MNLKYRMIGSGGKTRTSREGRLRVDELTRIIRQASRERQTLRSRIRENSGRNFTTAGLLTKSTTS